MWSKTSFNALAIYLFQNIFYSVFNFTAHVFDLKGPNYESDQVICQIYISDLLRRLNALIAGSIIHFISILRYPQVEDENFTYLL